MAEAENTTTSSEFSRRTLLAGGAAMLLAPATSREGLLVPPRDTDPVLGLWQDWRKLYAEAVLRHVEWQEVETLLFRTVGFPSVTVDVPGGDSFEVIDHASIDDLLGSTPETQALRTQLHADLTAHRTRWDEAAAARRFDDLDKSQDAAHQRADAATEPLFEAPATTLAGVAAKLALILELGQASEQDRQFPWPQLRSTFADVHRLASGAPLFPRQARSPPPRSVSSRPAT